MPDREKKIAEIREAVEKEKPEAWKIGYIRFLLSERDRLEREYAEERAAHNAHVAELCELEKENRKLRKLAEDAHVLIEQGKEFARQVEELQKQVHTWKSAFKSASEQSNKRYDYIGKLEGRIEEMQQDREKLIRGLRNTRNIVLDGDINNAIMRLDIYVSEILKEIGVTIDE